MSGYTSFAVVGAGGLGKRIVDDLAAKNTKVIVLARPESASKPVPGGVKVVPVNYSDVSSVEKALKENAVEVVISTLNGDGLKSQRNITDAAKAAGVKLFVLSEWGVPTHGYKEGLLGLKDGDAEHLKAIGLPSLRIYVGFFTQYLPWIFGISENKKFNVIGDASAANTITAEEDIAGFTAHVLTSLSPSELSNKIFRIESEHVTAEEAAKALGVEIAKVQTIPGENAEFQTLLASVWGQGAVSTGWNPTENKEGTGEEAAGSSNKLWPGHQWKTIADIHGKK